MKNNTLINDALLHPNGRFGRLSLIAWLTILTLILCSLNLYISLQMLNTDEDFKQTEPLALFLWATLHISCIYTFFILIIRRLHDLNRSGWWSVLILIPIVQVLFLFLIFVTPGSFHNNQYGSSRLTPIWEKTVALISIICTPILTIVVIYILAISPPPKTDPQIEFEGSHHVMQPSR